MRESKKLEASTYKIIAGGLGTSEKYALSVRTMEAKTIDIKQTSKQSANRKYFSTLFIYV